MLELELRVNIYQCTIILNINVREIKCNKLILCVWGRGGRITFGCTLRRVGKVKSLRRNIFQVGKYVYICGRLKKGG